MLNSDVKKIEANNLKKVAIVNEVNSNNEDWDFLDADVKKERVKKERVKKEHLMKKIDVASVLFVITQQEDKKQAMVDFFDFLKECLSLTCTDVCIKYKEVTTKIIEENLQKDEAEQFTMKMFENQKIRCLFNNIKNRGIYKMLIKYIYTETDGGNLLKRNNEDKVKKFEVKIQEFMKSTVNAFFLTRSNKRNQDVIAIFEANKQDEVCKITKTVCFNNLK